MKNRLFRILSAAVICAAPSVSQARDFFDKGPAQDLFNVGVSLGFNTSNKTFSDAYFRAYNVNNWGLGLDLGATVDINLRDWIAIQPGFFIGSRKGNYAYVQKYIPIGGVDEEVSTQLGKYKSYNLTVPLMASVRFNVTDRIRWSVEAGPYAQFRLHANDKGKISVIIKSSERPGDYLVAKAHGSKLDAGFKIGTGLTFNRHYSVFAHYLAGANYVWKAPVQGGHAKQWLFTLAYTIM